jgi:hypothetical protein
MVDVNKMLARQPSIFTKHAGAKSGRGHVASKCHPIRGVTLFDALTLPPHAHGVIGVK